MDIISSLAWIKCGAAKATPIKVYQCLVHFFVSILNTLVYARSRRTGKYDCEERVKRKTIEASENISD